MNSTENKHKVLEFQPTYMLTRSKVTSDWWHALSMEGRFAKRKLFPNVRPVNRLLDDLTLLPGKMILNYLDSSYESTKWSLKLRQV